MNVPRKVRKKMNDSSIASVSFESPMLDTNQAAEYLHVSASYLVKKRISGGGPKFVKEGRKVLYPIWILKEYINKKLVNSTSEATNAR